jgi:hypothetical protein
MKKYKFEMLLILCAFAALIVAIFSGCDDHNRNDLNNPRLFAFDSPQYAIVDYLDVQDGIQDATLDNDMSFNNVLLNYSFMNADPFNPSSGMMGSNPWLKNFDNTKRIGWILRSLDLTVDQKNSINGFAQSYHDSMKVLVKLFHDEIKNLITNANDKRHLILDSLRTRQITKEQAVLDLRALNQSTRNAIDSDPVVQNIKNDMCQQRSKLFDNISSVLTADQLAEWNKMIVKIKNPC